MLSSRSALQVLVEAVISTVAATGKSIAEFRGIAYYDPRRDAFVTGHGSFEPAVAEVSKLPRFQERFGTDAAHRLVLQFVYEVLERLQQPAFAQVVFDAVWDAFKD